MAGKVLWLIAARSGSKSIPNKNIKVLGDLPLLHYRIKAAANSGVDGDIWISTDSSQYISIAEQAGAKAPFVRPAELAGDMASSVDVVLHAMNYAEEKMEQFDAIGLLEPTSPFIYPNTLKAATEQLLGNSEADSIVAVREQRPNTFFIQDEDVFLTDLAKRIEDSQQLGRQNFNKQITPSGGFYISRWKAFKQNKSFYTSKTLGYEVDEIEGLEIDEPIDWDLAEFFVERKKVDLSQFQ